jgi:hypothetical protein
MAKIRIEKPDGTPSPYFWSDREESARDHKTVYKETEDGVKRMRGVHFDAVKKRMHRHGR